MFKAIISLWNGRPAGKLPLKGRCTFRPTFELLETRAMLTVLPFPGSLDVRDLNHLSPAADLRHSHTDAPHVAVPFHSPSHGPDRHGDHRQPRDHGHSPTLSEAPYSAPTFAPGINSTEHDVVGVDASPPILTGILFEETLTLREPTLLVGEGEPSATFDRASSDEATYLDGPQSLDFYTLSNVYDLFGSDVVSRSMSGETGWIDTHLATNGSDRARAIDAAFVPTLPFATANSLADQHSETDLLTDKALIDIAEVLEDRFGWQPRRLRIGDRGVEREPTDDHLPTNSASPHDSNELGWLLHLLDRSESPDDDVADQGRDMAEQGPTDRRHGAEAGMIELSHFHGPRPIPSANGAIVVIGAASTDGTGTVEFVKTDSSSARYQAFDLASQLVDPTSADPTLDEGSGESTPANLSPTSRNSTPDDDSSDTDTRARSASSSTKVSAASALFAGFFWRRRARRHRSRPQST